MSNVVLVRSSESLKEKLSLFKLGIGRNRISKNRHWLVLPLWIDWWSFILKRSEFHFVQKCWKLNLNSHSVNDQTWMVVVIDRLWLNGWRSCLREAGHDQGNRSSYGSQRRPRIRRERKQRNIMSARAFGEPNRKRTGKIFRYFRTWSNEVFRTKKRQKKLQG